MPTKQSLAAITKEADGTIEFIASHQLVDRDGEVVLISGIETTDFDKNPVFLEQHAHGEPAIGKVVRWSKTIIMGVPALVCKAQFFVDRLRSAEALADVRVGGRRGISIGFQSLEVGPPILPGQTGVTHERTKLLEISLVTLPSCPTCLVTSIKAVKSSCSCGSGDTLELRDDSLAVEIIEPMDRLELAEDFVFTDDTKSLNKAIGSVFAREFSGFLAKEVSTSLRDSLDYARGRVR